MAEKKFNTNFMRRLFKHKLSVIGLTIILLMIVVSLFAGVIAPDPYSMNLDAKLIPPMKEIHAAKSKTEFLTKEYIYEVSKSEESFSKEVGLKSETVLFEKIGVALDVRLSDGSRAVVPTNSGTLQPGTTVVGESDEWNTFRSNRSVDILKSRFQYAPKGKHTKSTKEVVAGDMVDVEWEDAGIAYIVVDSETGNKRLHAEGQADLTPTEIEIGPMKRPLLGTDSAGRDIAQRLIHGARISLYVGVVVIFISLLIGITLGALAGFYGGLTDSVISRFTDIMFAFPGLLFAIAVMAVLGRDLVNVFIALGLVGWPPIVRIIRGEIIALKESEFVEAAKSMGARNSRIIIKHLLPNTLAPIIVYSSLGIAGAIMSEAGLSFLGIGVRPPMPSWGSMINEGFQHALASPHVWLVPGVLIAIVVLAFNFLGDGLRDALDPKLKI